MQIQETHIHKIEKANSLWVLLTGFIQIFVRLLALLSKICKPFLIYTDYASKTNGKETVHPRIDTSQLQPGDIVLTKSFTFNGKIIGIGSYFTHAVLYLGDTPEGTQQVAEAVGHKKNTADEIVVRPLTETGLFTQPMQDWVVIRPNATAEQRASAIAYARTKAQAEGTSYSYNPYKATRDSEKHFYCSQLIWKAYQHAGFDFEMHTRSLDWLLPDILYPYISPDDLYHARSAMQQQAAADVQERGQVPLDVLKPIRTFWHTGSVPTQS